jgi:imidazolonepropionase
MADLLLTNIGHLTTNDGEAVHRAAVSIRNGSIEYAGREADAPEQGQAERVECGGRAVIPGFVDAHTHLVFAGDRSDEFSRRLAGEPYTGGGILSTVESTRAASEDRLFELASARVRRMIANGTTTLEIKSGYGLDAESERSFPSR